MNSLTQILSSVSIMALPLLMAIVFHEYAHGWVANFFGDSTAKQLGRLTMNPLKHIDLVGTIIVPALCLLAPGNLLFGWAKPVPVNSDNLHNPRRDMAFVAAAGPAMNLFLLIVSAIVLSLILSIEAPSAIHTEGEPQSNFMDSILLPVAAMAQFSILINTILMVINLIPIPPLDGGRILTSLLPHQQALLLRRLEPYGMLIFIGLIMTDSYTHIIRTIILTVFQFLSATILPS